MGVVVICWLILGVVEGLRLIGSTNPGNSPLLSIRSKQIADEVAEYGSLGFSQTYYLTEEDTFDFFIDIADEGAASISVTMRNRQSIRYSGEISYEEE